MKRLIVAVTILLVSVGLGIFSLFFVEKACSDAVTSLEKILESAVTENREEVTRLAVQTNREWKEKNFLLNILIGRAQISTVDKSLSKITYFAEIAEYESIILNAEDCKEELLYIIESNEPKLSTVF